MVKDHYAKLGFTPVEVEEQKSQWQLDIHSFIELETAIEIVGTDPATIATTEPA